LNDVPFNVTASSNKIQEDTKPGSVVATFTTIDHDKGQQHSYNLLDNAGKSLGKREH
jgi:hypothetical protein